MNVKELLESKIYVKENGSFAFKSPKSYVEPFLEIVSKQTIGDVRVRTSNAVVNAEESGIRNTAYPRVNVEVTVGTEIEGFQSVMGVIYALDTQRPVIKVYTGQNVSVCMNLTIFNTEHLFEQTLLSDHKEVYSKSSVFLQNKLKEVEEYGKIITNLKESSLNPNSLNEILGRLLTSGANGRLGTSPVVGAAKLLTDPKTIYYTKSGDDFDCSKWNVYNAVTQALTDSNEFASRPVKTIELAKILQEEFN